MFCFWSPWNQWHKFISLLFQLNTSGQSWRILPHCPALSLHNEKPYWTEMKKKARELRKRGVCLPPPSVVIDIGGLILHLGLLFLKWAFFFFFFLSAKKTAEAVEMELVVCRCMRERDYLTVMSALLNTITPYRSARDPRRICCLLKRVWKCM